MQLWARYAVANEKAREFLSALPHNKGNLDDLPYWGPQLVVMRRKSFIGY